MILMRIRCIFFLGFLTSVADSDFYSSRIQRSRIPDSKNSDKREEGKKICFSYLFLEQKICKFEKLFVLIKRLKKNLDQFLKELF
jgi:hypothetical protein